MSETQGAAADEALEGSVPLHREEIVHGQGAPADPNLRRGDHHGRDGLGAARLEVDEVDCVAPEQAGRVPDPPPEPRGICQASTRRVPARPAILASPAVLARDANADVPPGYLVEE